MITNNTSTLVDFYYNVRYNVLNFIRGISNLLSVDILRLKYYESLYDIEKSVINIVSNIAHNNEEKIFKILYHNDGLRVFIFSMIEILNSVLKLLYFCDPLKCQFKSYPTDASRFYLICKRIYIDSTSTLLEVK